MGLTIEAATLDPEFDGATREYSADVSGESGTVTATPADESVDIVITYGDAVIENGGSAEWLEGENDLVVTVTYGEYDETVYTVAITKTAEPEEEQQNTPGE